MVCSYQLPFGTPSSPTRSIHSALKDFFQPLGVNDTRADSFAVYRRESEEFDRGYAKKYDEDLNTSLIFVSRQDFHLEVLNQLDTHRPVFSQLSPRRSSSMFNPTSNPIRTR